MKRQGIVLFEIIVAMTILGIILGICVMALIEAVHMERAETAALVDTQVLHSLSRRMAADIHASSGLGDFAGSIATAGVPPWSVDQGGFHPTRLVLHRGEAAGEVVYEPECDTGGAITGVVRLEIEGGQVRSRRVTAVDLSHLSWEPEFEGERMIGVRTCLRLLQRDRRGRAINDREWFMAFRVDGR